MTASKKAAQFWTALGFLFSLAVMLVVSGGLAGRVWMTDQEAIPEAADAVMEAVHSGSWDALDALVAGSAGLTPETGAEGSPEALIWNAYLESIRWNREEAFTVQGSYVCQSVNVTCLDIAGLTDRIAQMLTDSGHSPQDLLTAVETALCGEIPTMQQQITLRFVREQGVWQLVPDGALQSLLSGFTVH